MSETRRLGRPECDGVLDELEELKAGEVTPGEVLRALTAGSSRHAMACENCRAAIEDFVETREGLAAMTEPVPQSGPWFVARVMAAVKAAENEIEEKKEGVWVSVRRLAPRLAAFAALLLVLGGTWVMELRHRDAAQMRQGEGLFETGPSAPLNDDIVASAAEGARP